MDRRGRRRIWLAGLLTLPSLGLALISASALHWPNIDGLRTLARIVDSLTLHLAAVAMVAALVLWALGGWRSAVLTAAITLAGLGVFGERHMRQSLAMVPDATTDLTVLWFNILGDNETPQDVLVQALIDSPADVVVIGEAIALRGALAPLEAVFPHRLGCAARRCDLLILARNVEVDALWSQNIGATREERLMGITVSVPDRAPTTVLGAHLVKPWFFGFSEREEWWLWRELAQLSGPLVMVGDFNSAPWAKRMQMLVSTCDLRYPRRPPATWPVPAGPLGVPIDQILMRQGPVLAGIETWGADLGSNHLGLLARVSLPRDADPDPIRPDCDPEVGYPSDR